jgi:hypothetical protein
MVNISNLLLFPCWKTQLLFIFFIFYSVKSKSKFHLFIYVILSSEGILKNLKFFILI